VDIATDSDTGATTSDSSGSQTPTSSSGGGSTGLALNLANAISAVYGIFEDTTTAYTVNELAWAINGIPYTGIVTALGGGWYELAITNYIIDPLTLRPLSLSNTLSVEIPVPFQVDKRARINVQIELRSNIQSLRVV